MTALSVVMPLSAVLRAASHGEIRVDGVEAERTVRATDYVLGAATTCPGPRRGWCATCEVAEACARRGRPT